jgi:hypothetical protein
VVEGTGLENQRAGNRTVGSNPTLSAKLFSLENDVASQTLARQMPKIPVGRWKTVVQSPPFPAAAGQLFS